MQAPGVKQGPAARGLTAPSPRLSVLALAGGGAPLAHGGGQRLDGLHQLPLLACFWRVVSQHTRSSFRL